MSGRQKIVLLAPLLLLALLTIGDRVWPLEHGRAALAERYPERQPICLFMFWSFGPGGKRSSRVYFVPPHSGKRLRAMVVTQTGRDAEVRESSPALLGASLFWLLLIGGGVRHAKRMERRAKK